jgi:hypothetical protein
LYFIEWNPLNVIALGSVSVWYHYPNDNNIRFYGKHKEWFGSLFFYHINRMIAFSMITLSGFHCTVFLWGWNNRNCITIKYFKTGR